MHCYKWNIMQNPLMPLTCNECALPPTYSLSFEKPPYPCFFVLFWRQWFLVYNYILLYCKKIWFVTRSSILIFFTFVKNTGVDLYGFLFCYMIAQAQRYVNNVAWHRSRSTRYKEITHIFFITHSNWIFRRLLIENKYKN